MLLSRLPLSHHPEGWDFVRLACIMRAANVRPEPRSEERRVGKSVDLGGRRIIKKKTLAPLSLG